jgi:hypothetical protein
MCQHRRVGVPQRRRHDLLLLFWSVYAPIALLILWLIADTLRQHLQVDWKFSHTITAARRHRHP